MRGVIVLLALILSGCAAAAPPVVTPNLFRPMAIHTCVPGANVWLDGAGVPNLNGVTDKNGNIEFPVFPAALAAFNVHATADTHPEYGAVIVTTPSSDPLVIILGSCAR
jgi:hypothetical protein